jgi:hypothetical protein
MQMSHNFFAEQELILTRSLTMVQHLCLWHLSTDMQMSHNSFAERELILTRSLMMVQHLYLWLLSQARPDIEHPVRYLLNATQQASGSSIHYGATPRLRHLSTNMQMSHNSLAEQADTDKEFNDGATPLLVASQRGHADVAQPLCEARADIDKKFDDGATDIYNEFDDRATPLLVASLRGHADVAQLLRRARADTDKEFNDGAIPLLWHLSQARPDSEHPVGTH